MKRNLTDRVVCQTRGLRASFHSDKIMNSPAPSAPSALAWSPAGLASPGVSTVRNSNHRTAFSGDKGVNQKWTALMAVVTVLLLLPACTRATDIDQEKKNVRQVLENYLQSVKTADLTLASQVWLQSPDVSVVTPFGRFQGWESVRDGVYVNFLQKAFVERNLQPDNLAISVAGDTAWAVFDWTFAAKLANGQSYSSKGWESHVYRKTDRGWAIVHLHYSVPPPRS